VEAGRRRIRKYVYILIDHVDHRQE
jgi:hypothetical protein